MLQKGRRIDITETVSYTHLKIQEAMSKETDIFTSDMKSIETQIDTKLQEISKITEDVYKRQSRSSRCTKRPKKNA